MSSSAGATSVAPALTFKQLLDIAIVAVDAANVYTSPSIASAPIEQIPYGTPLQVVAQVQYVGHEVGDRRWFEVVLPDQRSGWVAANGVQIGMPGAPLAATPTPSVVQRVVSPACACWMLDSNGNYVWSYYANGDRRSAIE